MARLSLAALLLGAVASLPAAAQQGGLFRAYLSLGGNDANPCTLAQPCRLLPRALTVVASGGEVWMLDSANYNSTEVTINKSVTILAVPGALGSVVGVGPGALRVVSPATQVVLRNLNILPLPGALNDAGNGVTIPNPGITVHLEGSDVSGFWNGNGVAVPVASFVEVARSTFRRNGTAVRANEGAQVSVLESRITNHQVAGLLYEALAVGTNGVGRLSLTRSQVRQSVIGVIVQSTLAEVGAAAYVSESRLEENTLAGVRVVGLDGAASAVVQNSFISGSSMGLHATGANVRLFAAGNTLANVGQGLVQQNGAILSTTGNNQVGNSAVPGSGTLSPWNGV